MIPNNLFAWYEDNLPVKERKQRGHFSTPPHLVKQILDACGYIPQHELAPLRVLDPACGSGNFVTEAALRLITYGKQVGLSQAAIANLVRHNIWGFDPDPVACFLAEMQMRNALLDQATPERGIEKRKRGVNKSMLMGNVQIHQADGLAFPWQQGGQVDLLLANPPYLAAKNNDLSIYRFAQQRGQADSYLLFLELALQVVRPDGWLGLVLPDPVLARSNAARERKRLLAETTVHHLWHLADVFAAYVGVVVIVAQKRPPPSTHYIAWRREHWQKKVAIEARIEAARDERSRHEVSGGESGSVSQRLLYFQEGAELRYLLNRLHRTPVERFQPQPQFQIRRGEEISKESPLLSRRPSRGENDEDWYPVLRGGSDVHPYEIPHTQYWISRDKILKPLERYLQPKLLIVKSSDRLQACLDLQGHVVLQTLYMLSIHKHSESAPATSIAMPNNRSPQQHTEDFFTTEDELYYLLALFNSRLLQEYVYVMHTAYKWVQPQIEQRVLAQLPIPREVDTQAKMQIIQRAKQIMYACSESSSDVELKEQRQAWYEEQEQAIGQLYQEAIQERRLKKLSLSIF
jgi:SAM-dependent methyltransferase